MKNLANRENVFYVVVITLIFISIPPIIRLNFIGGIIASKLVVYPLYFGVLLEIYCLYKGKNNIFYDLRDNPYLARGIGVFLLLYVIITFLSLLHGMFIYPYYDVILNGPANQIEKLPWVLDFLNHHGIDITEKKLLSIWMVARPIKGFFVNLFATYILSFMLFMWCRNQTEKYFQILVKGTLIAVEVLLVYCLVEVQFLAHSDWAGNVLSAINPYIHDIKEKGSWWPPLLWKNQLRSLFAEPSYFGIYAAFAMPIVWYKFLSENIFKKKMFIGLILLLYTFCLFLTNARTAFGLFLGELILLLIYTIYFSNRRFWIHTLIIAAISLASFGGAVGFISYTHQLKNPAIEKTLDYTAIEYVDSNLNSLGSEDKRSNRSRFSVMKADFEIGLEHPVLGVGTGFRSAYVGEKLSQLPKKNHEIETWIARQQEMGIMKSGFPSLGQYTTVFSEGGILGLLVWLFPSAYLLYHLLILLVNDKSRYDIGFFMISFLSIMAAGIGDTINITYCYWVLLAMGYALWFDWKDKQEK